MHRALWFACLLSLIAAEPPATRSKVTFDCAHVGKQPIAIDGLANEPAWQLGKPLKDFRLIKSLKAPNWATEARFVWDDRNLYAFFDCAADGIRTEIVRRDDPVWNAECAEVFLCPKGADAVYYEFNFNPKDAIYDSRLEDWKYEAQSKNWQKWAKNYNAKIKHATKVNRDRAGKVVSWTVEAAIPFADFDVTDGKAPSPGDLWLFNAFRIAVQADGTTEYSHWQPVEPEFHRPHQFPRLKFVK